MDDVPWNLRVPGGSLSAAAHQSKEPAREGGLYRGILRSAVRLRDILVRVDHIFMSRRGLAVDRDGLEVQGFEQRYLAGVGAGEGGFQFRGNALLEPLRGGGSA